MRDDIQSSSHTKWNCKYYIVLVPDTFPVTASQGSPAELLGGEHVFARLSHYGDMGEGMHV